MATAISEQIAAIVRTRLLAIDEDDGYETTVTDVHRSPRIKTSRPRDYLISVTQGPLTPNPQLSHMGNPPAQAWTLPMQIMGELRPSETLTTALDTLRNEFAADCIKAICSVTDWHNWSGLAINSQIGTVTNYANGESTGFRLGLNIIFRTNETSPYVSRT